MLSNERQRRQTQDNKTLMLRQNALIADVCVYHSSWYDQGFSSNFSLSRRTVVNKIISHVILPPILCYGKTSLTKCIKFTRMNFISGFTWTGNLRGPILSENFNGIQRRNCQDICFYSNISHIHVTLDQW